jgi:hypothetical protein
MFWHKQNIKNEKSGKRVLNFDFEKFSFRKHSNPGLFINLTTVSYGIAGGVYPSCSLERTVSRFTVVSHRKCKKTSKKIVVLFLRFRGVTKTEKYFVGFVFYFFCITHTISIFPKIGIEPALVPFTIQLSSH